MIAGLAAPARVGALEKPRPKFSETRSLYLCDFPFFTLPEKWTVHWNLPSPEFQLQAVLTGLMPGPLSVTRTSCALDSDRPMESVTFWLLKLVSRNRTVNWCAALRILLPGTGAVRPPKRNASCRAQPPDRPVEFFPFGQVVADQVTPVSAARNRSAPVRLAPLRSDPVRLAPDRLVLTRLAFDRSIPARLAPARFWPARLAPLRLAPGPIRKPSRSDQPAGSEAGVPVTSPETIPLRLSPARLTPSRLAPVTTVPAKLAPARLALARLALERLEWSKIVPVRFMPCRSAPTRPSLLRSAPGPTREPLITAQLAGRDAGVPVICRPTTLASVVLAMTVLFSEALLMKAWVRLALVMLTDERSTFVSTAPVRLAVVRMMPATLAPLKVACVRFAPARFAPLRLAWLRLAFVRLQPAQFTPADGAGVTAPVFASTVGQVTGGGAAPAAPAVTASRPAVSAETPTAAQARAASNRGLMTSLRSRRRARRPVGKASRATSDADYSSRHALERAIVVLRPNCYFRPGNGQVRDSASPTQARVALYVDAPDMAKGCPETLASVNFALRIRIQAAGNVIGRCSRQKINGSVLPGFSARRARAPARHQPFSLPRQRMAAGPARPSLAGRPSRRGPATG